MYVQVEGLKKKLGQGLAEILQLCRHNIGVAASPDEGEDLSSGVPPLGNAQGLPGGQMSYQRGREHEETGAEQLEVAP